MSEISFIGGKVGFSAGSQQYTARKLKFTRSEVAIEMSWSWGFLWKNIEVDSCKVGINATASGLDGNTGKMQSTGSLTILDSTFKNVEKMLIVGADIKGYQPNVVIDNVKIDNACKVAVSDSRGKQILPGGAQTIEFWAVGRRYNDDEPKGSLMMGYMQPPRKDKSLLYGKDFQYFENDKPQYSSLDASNFLNILDYGVPNDGTFLTNNAKKINAALWDSANQHKVLVFPAGTYKTEDTIFIPPGARLVGALWSQIMASGPTFSDVSRPKVLAR